LAHREYKEVNSPPQTRTRKELETPNNTTSTPIHSHRHHHTPLYHTASHNIILSFDTNTLRNQRALDKQFPRSLPKLGRDKAPTLP